MRIAVLIAASVIGCGGGHGDGTGGDAGAGDDATNLDAPVSTFEPCPPPSTSVCSTTHCNGNSADCVKGWTCETTGQIDDRCVCRAFTEICDGADNDCDGVIDNPTETDPLCAQQHGAGFGCDHATCEYCPQRCSSGCTQMSADIANCTACGHACVATAGSGTTCSQTGCKDTFDLAPDEKARVIAVDDQYVVWADYTGKLYRCAVPDCAGGPTLLASNLEYDGGLGIVAHTIYYASGGALASCPETDCSAPVLLHPSASVFTSVQAIGDHVYWLTDVGAAIASCAASSCVATTTKVVPDRPNSYQITAFGGDGTTVTWIEQTPQGGSPHVMACAAIGCPATGATTLDPAPVSPSGVAMRNGRAYWDTYQQGSGDSHLASCLVDGSCTTPTDHGPIRVYGPTIFSGIDGLFPVPGGFAIVLGTYAGSSTSTPGAILGCVATGCESSIEVLAAPIAPMPLVVAGYGNALYVGGSSMTTSTVYRVQ